MSTAMCGGRTGCMSGSPSAPPGRHSYPGMLDNMVAGGQPAGLSLMENVVKEAGEEAGIPCAVAGTARPRRRRHLLPGDRSGPAPRHTLCVRPRASRRVPAPQQRRRGSLLRALARRRGSPKPSGTHRGSSSTAISSSSTSSSAAASSARKTRTIRPSSPASAPRSPSTPGGCGRLFRHGRGGRLRWSTMS